MNNNKNSFPVTLSVLSTYLMIGALVIINPAIRSIQEAFPNTAYTTIILVSTLPSLLIIPSILISGRIAGIKVKFKTLSLIGLLLLMISGTVPYFTRTNFTVILAERALLGIALGMIYPLGNALVLRLFEGEKRASLLGIGVLVKSLGSVLFQFLGGLLASIAWYYVFPAHLVGFLPLILIILFLPEPEKIVESNSDKKTKVIVPARVWVSSILFAILTIILYPLFLNMSSYLKITGLGNATVAGTVLSLITVGGMLGGLTFGKFYKYTKRYVIATQLFCMAIGMLLLLYGHNLILLMIGMVIFGYGYYSMQPALFMIIGLIAKPNAMGFCASMVLAFANLAGFLCTYWIALIGKITSDAIISPLYIALIVFGITAILFIFINPLPKAKDESVKTV